MNGREDHIVLIPMRWARLVAGCIRWIEREFTEESLTAGITGSDALQVVQIGKSHPRIVMEPLQVRSIPALGQIHIGRPDPTRMAQCAVQLHKHLPLSGCAGWHWKSLKGGSRVGSRIHGIKQPRSMGRSDARDEL